MPLRDLLRKKEKIQDDSVSTIQENSPTEREKLPQFSDFTFIRTDTNSQDLIAPPQYDDDEGDYTERQQTEKTSDTKTTPKKRFARLRGLSQASSTSDGTSSQKEPGRLSRKLHLGSKHDSSSSVNIPSDLPDVSDAYSAGGDEAEKEAKWEERATILGTAARPTSPANTTSNQSHRISTAPQFHKRDINPSPTLRSVSDADSDVNIQEAIRLHESGSLAEATTMFHILAEQGNVLAQVLYGLSLRHGWGCTPDLPRAVTYLSNAAADSASVEAEALKAGLKRGGAAKGELVLAIFELGNCYRYGWGVGVDMTAARHYYETAANLGDTDAMNEAAWCYMEGQGGKKDKFKAAQLLRLAEKNGSKTLGNTWIWKEKYNPK